MRNNCVSIAKALAIISVVMMHGGTPPYMSKFFGMMQLPVFLFLSGYCFKKKYLTDARTFITKRITGVYWPFVKWETVFLLCHNLFIYVGFYSEQVERTRQLATPLSWHFIKTSIPAIFIQMNNIFPMLGGLWFLKSLFWGSLIFYLVYRFLPIGHIARILLLLALTFCFSYFKISIPYVTIETSELFGAFFIAAGHAYKEANWHFEKKSWFIVLSVIVAAIGSVYCFAQIRRTPPTLVLPYAAIALLGSLMLLGISHYIEKYFTHIQKALVYIGDHTIEVLTWHFLWFKVVSLFVILFLGLKYYRIADFPVIGEFAFHGGWIVYTIAGVGIPILWNLGLSKLLHTISTRHE